MAVRDARIDDTRPCPPPVVKYDNPSYPTGRPYESIVTDSKIPVRPKIVKTDQNCLVYDDSIMISVEVKPTEGSLPDLEMNASYSLQTQYFNRTENNFMVTDRQNLTVTIPKSKILHHRTRQAFVVRRHHTFSNREAVESALENHRVERGNLIEENTELLQVLEQLEKELNRGNIHHNSVGISVFVDRLIPVELLTRYASIYISDLDILVRLDGQMIYTPHPTSKDAMLRGEFLEQTEGRPVSGGLYEIVDNESSFAQRFISVGTDIIELPILRDRSRKSGVYAFKAEFSQMGKREFNLQYYPLEDMNKLGIYPTREEALGNGNAARVFEREMIAAKMELDRFKVESERAQRERDLEIANMRHERALLENKLQMEKSSRDQELGKSEFESEMERLRVKDDLERRRWAQEQEKHLQEIQANIQRMMTEQMKDRLDREKMERADHYDRKSQARKNTSELLKQIPAIIAGVASIVALVLATKSNTTGK